MPSAPASSPAAIGTGRMSANSPSMTNGAAAPNARASVMPAVAMTSTSIR